MLTIQNWQQWVTEPGGKEICIAAVAEWQLAAGEEWCVVGPSGSGKTTLLHLLAGLITPTCGAVYWQDARLDTQPEGERDRWRAAHVGYVFQNLNLLPQLTVLENVVLPAAWQQGRITPDVKQRGLALLKRVGLAARQGERPRFLSMGEQQRVAVARAVIQRPTLLLADEPTASLDADNSAAVLKLMRELTQEAGSTLVVATHDAAVKALFTRQYHLQRQEGVSRC